MPGIFLAPSSVVSPPSGGTGGSPGGGTATRTREAFSMTWQGWDGTVWDLTDGTAGLFLVPTGVRGLAMPPIDRFTQESPAVAGTRWRGSRAGEREVFWPLYIFSDGTAQDWVDYDRAFWRTMHPDLPGVWTVAQPDGTMRSLTARFADDGDHSFQQDPAKTGWELYAITLVAEQPYWQGTPIIRTWRGGTGTSGFFGAGAPPFTIGSGATLDVATIDNPGDVPAYPVYTISGPTTSVTVGIGGRIVEVPFAIASGQSLTIDTGPTAQTAFDSNGVDRTGELGAVDFAPIPPGVSLQMSLQMAGTGTVSGTITPLYRRAW